MLALFGAFLAPLAIAAALDRFVREERKAQFANWLLSVAKTAGPSAFRASDALDAFFGPLLSRRAHLKYSAISLCSLVVSYGVAWVPIASIMRRGIMMLYFFPSAAHS